MTTQDNDYVTRAREYNRQVWEGIQKLLALQAQWNALDYGNTLIVSDEGLTAADIGAVVFDAANAFNAVLATGIATNMARLLYADWLRSAKIKVENEHNRHRARIAAS